MMVKLRSKSVNIIPISSDLLGCVCLFVCLFVFQL